MKPRTPAVTPSRLAEAAGRLRTVFAATLAAAAPALAQTPQGPQVVAGSATFQQNGSTTVITAGNNTIINYQSFNIGHGQTVQFVQPSATSKVLNRVTGPDPSRIAGTLLANGIVYIVNPAGIYFAQGSLVNVGGIYAAAGNITNADFLNNVNRFTGAGPVENHGTINAHAAHLVGAKVANFGAINAPNGMVTMSAGGEVYVGEQHGQIFARVSGSAGGDTGVIQAGEINAQGGQVRLGAGDMYAMAIDHPGRTKARDITVQGGQGGVVSISGRIDASDRSAGGVGGTVRVFGDRIGLFGGEIDASGDAGGGRVLVGGDYQGAGDAPRAQATYVSPDARISADAVRAGDGGTVVVWSDHYTNYQGHISARGGAWGGSGGFVETSGKAHLFMNGSVDAAAPRGRGGLWLLDPTDVTLSNSPTSGGSLGSGVFTPDPVATANVNLGEIETALAGGTSVTITTASAGAGSGDITLLDAFSPNLNLGNGPVTLTLNADRDILITGGGINASGVDALSLVFSAGGNIVIDHAITLNGGSFTLTAPDGISLGADLTTGGGDLRFNSPLTLTADVTLSGNDINFISTVNSDGTARNLTVNSSTSGLTSFNGAIGGVSALNILTTNADGATLINAPSVTAATLNFDDNVVIGVDTVLTATGSVDFAGIVRSQMSEANDLTITAPSVAFHMDVGAGAGFELGRLHITTGGTTTIDASQMFARRLEFDNAVVLGQDTTLNGSDVIAFRSTVDSEAGEANNLTLNAPVTNFNGQVGNAGADTALGALTTDADGTTTLNTAVVKADTVDFGDNVVLAFDVTITAPTSVTFRGAVDSRLDEARDLTVNSALTVFEGVVGGGPGGALGALTTDANGGTAIDAGAITADTIDFGDGVVLRSQSVINAATSVRFRKGLGSQANEANNLTIIAPTVTLDGAVGAAANAALGTFVIDANTSISLNGGTLNVSGAEFRGDTILGEDTVITAERTVEFEGTLNSQSGENNTLTINGPEVFFNGTVGGAENGALGAITTQAARLSGSVRTNGDQMYGGAVGLVGSTTLTGRNITFNGTLNSVLSDQALTINTTGDGTVRFNNLVGSGSFPLASLTINNVGRTVIAGGGITTSGDQNYGNAVVISDATSLFGSNVIFGGTVDSDGMPRSLTISATQGFAQFTSAVGSISALASLTVSSTQATRLNGGTIHTTGAQTYNGPVRLGVDTTLTASGVSFGGTLDSDSIANDLTINTGGMGLVTFSGQVGSIARLNRLSTDGRTQIFGGGVRTLSTQNYGGAVLLGEDTTLSGTDITFASTVDSTPLFGPVSLTINSGGTTTFTGAVGGENALQSLTTDSGGTTRIGGDVTTVAGMSFGEAVRIFSDATLTSQTSGGIAFNGLLDSEGGNHDLTLLIPGDVTATPGSPSIPRITFNGNVGGTTAFRNIRLGGDRSVNAAAATIGAGIGAGNAPISNFSLTINTIDDFTMGVGQRFTVLGDLTINAGGTATLGDLSTLGDMTINAPSIAINTRPGGATVGVFGGNSSALVNNRDPGVDFVAGGRITFSSTPTLLGGFAGPSFATPDATGLSANLVNFATRAFGPVTTSQLAVGPNYLDLRAAGPSTVNLAEAVAGAVPREIQAGEVAAESPVDRAAQEELQAIGVFARASEYDELLSFLSGQALYIDVPDRPSPAAEDYQITVNRLPAAAVREVLDSYRAVFTKDGQPQPQRPRQALEAAWKEYAAAAGDRADALGFRAYLEAVPAQAEALYYLDGLRELLADLGSLGLSPAELRAARRAVLNAVAFPGLPPEQLESAITARYLGIAASAR